MNNLIRGMLPVLLGGGLVLSTAAAASTLNSDDQDFVKNAAKGGMTEVELGRLAEQKATNPEVKNFASRMVRDHSKADQQLTNLAAAKGVDLPSGKGLMNDATYLKLKVLSGAAFDKAYVNAMVDDHKQDVADFEKESESAQDPAVRNFAAKTLPTLKEHLTVIEKIQSDIGAQ
jgi:putative membrane protein